MQKQHDDQLNKFILAGHSAVNLARGMAPDAPIAEGEEGQEQEHEVFVEPVDPMEVDPTDQDDVDNHNSFMGQALEHLATATTALNNNANQKVTMLSNETVQLLTELTESQINRLEQNLQRANLTPTQRSWSRFICQNTQTFLNTIFGSTHWQRETDAEVVKRLRDQIRAIVRVKDTHSTLEQMFEKLRTIQRTYGGLREGHWQENLNYLMAINTAVCEIMSKEDLTSTEKNVLQALRSFLDKSCLGLTAVGKGIIHNMRRMTFTNWSWEHWYLALVKNYQSAQVALVTSQAYREDYSSLATTGDSMYDPNAGSNPTNDRGSKRSQADKDAADKKRAKLKGNDNKGNDKPTSTTEKCRVCNRSCKRGKCRFFGHPDANKEKVPWEQSTNGKAWMARSTATNKITCLPVRDTLDPKNPTNWVPPKKEGMSELGLEQQRKVNDEHNKPSAQPPSMINSMIPIWGDNDQMYCQPCNQGNKNDLVHDADDIFSEPDDNGMRIMTLINTNSTLSDVRLKVLFDTGALGQGANYISKEAAAKLKTAGYEAYRTNKKVCSCFVGSYKLITQFYKLKLRYFDKTLGSYRTLTMKCDVIDTPHDVIIGFDTIRRCRMLRRTVFEGLARTSRTNTQPTTGRDTDEREVVTKVLVGDDDKITVIADWDEGGISYPDTTDDWNPYASVTSLNTCESTSEPENTTPKVIEGTASMQKGIHYVCARRRKVFSRSLNREPAKVKPYEIELDGDWLSRENQLPPRVVSFMKGVEIENQTVAMKESGVIGDSRAAAHSQVMLTVKPNGTWRFCIDYRRLNAVTKPYNWPLPKIKEMLERLGRKKAKWYGVIDLTKGYYQAPLHENSRHLTAFITPDGLYEWNRVPMGLSGAGPYFQRAMATEVLSGLNHIICEVYLDDIIIFGTTEEEYLKNLDAVLARLEEYNVTVNPDKCRLGLREVEYVGHLISQDGCHFSREKLQKVIEVVQPVTSQELKSFLGLANYFRDNVSNYAAITAPLQAMLTDYNAKRRLDWTAHPHALDAFIETKRAVNECPKLFWMDTEQTSEVHLYTDASKLGIGAYLCQRRADGVEYPIAFFSKSLSGAEKNWGVPELEGYAIYAAFKQFDYLLRDVHTHVHTDHKNLCYIRDTGSEKVIRWKMHLQEYSFDLAYVPGPENPIADFLSRDAALLAEVDDYEVEKPGKVANMLCTIMTKEYWPTVETILSNLNPESEVPKQVQSNIFNLKNVDLECNASWDKWEIPDDKYEIMKKVHNCVSGHHGVEATIAKLASLGHKWTGMREHVRRYIKECDTCQKHSYRQFEIKVPKFITGRYQPMEKISMDTIGPLPADADGNQHAVVIIDMFSRFMTIYPVKTTDSIDAAEALLNHIGHYGVPAQVQSDKGSQYVNDILAEFVELVGTEHVVGIAYSKEEQGIVERANGKVGEWVRKLIYDRKLEHTLWSKFLPFVQRLHNASKVSTTGFAPCQILFGDQVLLDRSILLPTENRNTPDDESLSDWMRSRRNAQDTIIQAAQEAQLELQEQAEFENALAKDYTEFEVGSYVLVSYPDTGFGPRKPTKLHMMHKGPYQVLGREDNNVKLLNLVNDKHEWKQIHLLRTFFYDKKRTNPVEVAQQDYHDEFYVEEVISHTGLRSRKSSLTFHIKWLGYADTTKEPWANVRLSPEVHDYMRKNNMANLIPKDLKADIPDAPYNPFPKTTARAKRIAKASATTEVKTNKVSKAKQAKKAKKTYEKLTREERAKRHAERKV